MGPVRCGRPRAGHHSRRDVGRRLTFADLQCPSRVSRDAAVAMVICSDCAGSILADFTRDHLGPASSLAKLWHRSMTRSPWQDVQADQGGESAHRLAPFPLSPRGSLMAAVVIWKKASDRARAILLGLSCKVRSNRLPTRFGLERDRRTPYHCPVTPKQLNARLRAPAQQEAFLPEPDNNRDGLRALAEVATPVVSI